MAASKGRNIATVLMILLNFLVSVKPHVEYSVSSEMSDDGKLEEL